MSSLVVLESYIKMCNVNLQLWKATKVLHVRVAVSRWRLRVWREAREDAGEQTTARADAEAMRYLAMLLYPLCAAGALYSLLYEPHKGYHTISSFLLLID